MRKLCLTAIYIPLLWLISSPSFDSLLAGCDTGLSETNRFGVVSHLSWAFFYSPEDIDRALTMMNDAGIGWVRLNWSWKDIEPERGEFNFSRFDLVAQMAAEHGIHLLAILTAMGPLSTDMYLPSLPAIGQAFATDAGQVQLFVTTPPSVLGHVKQGKLRAIAIARRPYQSCFGR